MEPIKIIEILKINFPKFRFSYNNGKIYLKKGYFPLIIIRVFDGDVVNIYTAFWLRISVGYLTMFLLNCINDTIKKIYHVLNTNHINVQILYEK